MKVLRSRAVKVPASRNATDTRAWWRVGFVLFAVGWGANHFASLLAVYRARLGLDAAAPAMLFGMYALGLVPGLLLGGPLSDRRGRRAIVLPSAALALGASVALGMLGDRFGLLLAGRLLYGLGAGGVISAGAVWLIELSGERAAGTGPRRATIALSSGFGLGPLATGLLAQYAPHPTFVPYAVHAVLLASALVRARGTSDTVAAEPTTRLARPLFRVELGARGWAEFSRGVAPMAPFVFGFPAIAFAALPSMLSGALGRAPLVFTGFLACITLAAGVLAQPATRRFEPAVASRLGLAVGAAGLVLGAVTVMTRAPAALLVVAPLLGCAYGICMTAGLQAVHGLARPEARGGITGIYYVLTYVGFAAPYLLAVASRVARPEVTLGISAVLASVVAVGIGRRGRALPRAPG